MADYLTLYVTVENEDVAVHMATALVKEKLVACANITAGVRSIYEWENTIQFDSEVVLVMKTTALRVKEAIERTKELHNYDVPCITATPIVEANAEYLEWVTQQTT